MPPIGVSGICIPILTGGCGGNAGGNTGGKISLGSSLSTIVLGGTNISSSLGFISGNLAISFGSGMLGGITGGIGIGIGVGITGSTGVAPRTSTSSIFCIDMKSFLGSSNGNLSNGSSGGIGLGIFGTILGLPIGGSIPLLLRTISLINPIINSSYFDSFQKTSLTYRCF